MIEAVNDHSNVVKEMIVTSASVDRHGFVMEDSKPEDLPKCKTTDLVTTDRVCETNQIRDQP